MSAFVVLGTGATRAAGTALVAGLLVVTGLAPAWASARTGEPASRPTHPRSPELATPERTRPGGPRGEITVRLPDGRVLHFSSTRPAVGGSRGPSSGVPSSGGSATGSPPGGSSGSPSASAPPSGGPSTSAVPLPVVSSLFPSPGASGSLSRHKPSPSGRPSRSSTAPRPTASTASTAPRSPAPAAVPQGGDAVPPSAEPDRPASSVPPPLGPQAVLQPDALGAQIAAPRSTPVGSALAHRGRLLGVGLALIGAGAALFGWRIRRL